VGLLTFRTVVAALVFYGPPPAKETLRRIKGPVYGFYGGNDNRINATIPATTEVTPGRFSSSTSAPRQLALLVRQLQCRLVPAQVVLSACSIVTFPQRLHQVER